jgi:flagellar export protein FliJ
MSKAARLEPLADHAEICEAEAARRLAASLRTLQAKQRELDRLRGYLAEYRLRAEQGGESVDSTRWQNTRLFIARLSDAVALQESELDRATESYCAEASRWRGYHRQAKTLEKLVDRYQRDELRVLEQRAQAELDERASRCRK